MYGPANQYRQTQVSTASPEKILLMLYDGAINFSKIAQDRMSRKDIAGKGAYVGKALAIVTELMNTLNHDVCGTVTQDLSRLYAYVIGEFVRANMENDAKALENAIAILSNLRETWTEAVAIVQREHCEGKSDQRMLGAG
jgi:flagellar secretion chaperone FliS